MKNMKKILVLACCAVLLVCISVGATFAYLTSTKTVTNTFTSGSVDITLDETDVDKYGVLDGQTRVTANAYTLLPGHEYIKDPTIHVTKGSEPVWLFVKVENGIADIESTEVDTIEKQMLDNGWASLSGAQNVYYYNTTVDARAAQQDVPVFKKFTIGKLASVDGYTGKTVVVTAYAVQADGFAGAAAAWTGASFN